MSLDISKLKNVCAHGDKTTAGCPACAEAGHDQKGEHLVINADGSFGCVVYPGDSAEAKGHRKRIFALCGDRKIKPLIVRSPVLGRLGQVDQSHSAGEPLKTGLLGRLGRVFQTHLEAEQIHGDREDRKAKKLNDCEKGVPGVPNMSAGEPHKPYTGRERAHKWHLLSSLRLPFVMVYSETLGETIFFCQDEDTKAALIEAGAEPWSIYTRDELQVLMTQNRIKPFTQAELRKVHDIKRTLGARIAE
jgi:hypothetical protein